MKWSRRLRSGHRSCFNVCEKAQAHYEVHVSHDSIQFGFLSRLVTESFNDINAIDHDVGIQAEIGRFRISCRTPLQDSSMQ